MSIRISDDHDEMAMQSSPINDICIHTVHSINTFITNTVTNPIHDGGDEKDCSPRHLSQVKQCLFRSILKHNIHPQ